LPARNHHSCSNQRANETVPPCGTDKAGPDGALSQWQVHSKVGLQMRVGSTRWLIDAKIGDVPEGLFGQVVLYVFEILPYLERKGVNAQWKVRSPLYGDAPDHLVIPGAFDVVQVQASASTTRTRNLIVVRNLHRVALGNDWRHLGALWSRHFAVPMRVNRRADSIGLGSAALGLHFRGTDKMTALWDTNPVSHADFLSLVADFIRTHPAIDQLFIATDDGTFLESARARFPHLAIATSGVADSHKAATGPQSKADHALLDCVLLSRCRWVLKTSSALSAFAKVLNPDLEIYRVAASKLFDVMPYFPVAYIPRLTSTDPVCSTILERLFKDDWTQDPATPPGYLGTFKTHEVPIGDKVSRTWDHFRKRLRRKLVHAGLWRH
ncbi:MAG: hypothetical protein ABIV63_01355, partial [Caldimonas sp.]